MTSDPDAAALPPDLDAILRELDASERDAASLVQGLDEARLNWRPAPAAWSVGQCLDHLNLSSRLYLGPMREAVAAARRRGWRRRGPIRPGAPSRWFLRQLVPGARSRLKAPRKIVPAPALGLPAVADEFARQQAAVRELLRAAADLDLNRARFANPFVPLVRFSLGTGFLVIATHQRRHLRQAAAVRAHPAFP